MDLARHERLRQVIRQEGLDALLITHPVNVTYLTGFSGDSSYLILTPAKAVLVSDGRFTTQLVEECPDLETFIRTPAQTVGEAAAEVLGKLAIRAVGFENGHLTVAEFDQLRGWTPGLDWKGAGDRVERLRAVKDAREIEDIRSAIRMAEKAFQMFRAMLRPEDQEKDLVDALEMYVRRAGGFTTSFPSIIAVGERSALPHAPPSAKRVSEGNLLLVDWGASGRFYKSDLTRVLIPHNNSPFRGTAGGAGVTAKLKEVYAVVLQAQRAALAVLRPGVKAGTVDAAAGPLPRRASASSSLTAWVTASACKFTRRPFSSPATTPSSRPAWWLLLNPAFTSPVGEAFASNTMCW